MTIEFQNFTLRNCAEAEGVVVVIDVLRAFTTAAVAFERGAKEIVLVATVDEAIEIRHHHPDILLLGEVEGRPIPGFDLPNSPSTLAGMDLRGKRLVQRTTAGTQGAVLAARASPLLVAGLSVAAATAAYLQILNPHRVSFVATGVRPGGGGEEDSVCAEYIASLIRGCPLAKSEVCQRVRGSGAAKKFIMSEGGDFPAADVESALRIDRSNFVMQVERRNAQLVLSAT